MSVAALNRLTLTPSGLSGLMFQVGVLLVTQANCYLGVDTTVM